VTEKKDIEKGTCPARPIVWGKGEVFPNFPETAISKKGGEFLEEERGKGLVAQSKKGSITEIQSVDASKKKNVWMKRLARGEGDSRGTKRSANPVNRPAQCILLNCAKKKKKRTRGKPHAKPR